ncbi:hypothetical protein SMICM304S_07527 [Streptomyces microflavus]
MGESSPAAGWSSAARAPFCCRSSRRARRTRGEGAVRRCSEGGALGSTRHPQTLAGNPAKWAEGARYAAPLARHRVPVRTRTAIVGAEGEGRVAVVRTAALDTDGRPLPGTERRIEADTVGVGWGFESQLDLLLPLGCGLGDAGDGTMAAAVDDGRAPRCPGCTRRARPAAWAGPRSR